MVSVAKVSEIIASSNKSFDAPSNRALRSHQTLKNVSGARSRAKVALETARSRSTA